MRWVTGTKPLQVHEAGYKNSAIASGAIAILMLIAVFIVVF
jgi:hypothetical protein